MLGGRKGKGGWEEFKEEEEEEELTDIATDGKLIQSEIWQRWR